MYKAIILPLAKQDIDDAASWYNEQQSNLGKRFTKSVKSKVKKICSNPYSYAVRYAAAQTALLYIFPFMIHFVVNEKRKTMVITAVLHTSQSPEIWKKGNNKCCFS